MKAELISLSDPAIWKWREHIPGTALHIPQDAASWRDVRHFPSEVHVELLEAGLIPDPFVGFNEHAVQWVGEKEWVYQCTFGLDDVRAQVDAGAYVQLKLEGLDTFCDVYMNEKKILEADNMFRTHTVDLGPSALSPIGHNTPDTLLLYFKSAKLIAKDLELVHGKVRAGSCNLGDPSRVYVRKAQYDWRWDWGPELMTCGPYRPISLLVYKARVAEIQVQAEVSAELAPSLSLSVAIAGDPNATSTVRCILRQHGDRHAHVLREETSAPLASSTEILKWSLDGVVELWWPVGYGKQLLYDVEVALIATDGSVLDAVTKRVGFRRVRLVQEPLQEADHHGKGTTFLFEVNGVRMFMGGSNWIPADSFLTRVTAERYRAWLTLLRDGCQNMVRVWGGGVYEPDVFYDICDELGLLVWQDFAFACGVYPAHPAFVASVTTEAKDNICRLRHHPCLALFCGNNEDYQQVLQWGDVHDLPARLIYETVLPQLVETLTNFSIPYHFGSPYGGEGWDTSDPTVGDKHQWDVWAGKERPWQHYGSMGGRFVSEFGVPAMPDVRTVDHWLGGDVSDRWPQSKSMAQHCRAGSFERRFAVLMNENFRFTKDFETYIYNQQIMQSEALSLAYRMWRRDWRGKGKEFCAGALVWQLNDCWPVTSWSLADYFLRPKAAYYTVARELRPLTVGIFRTVLKNRDNDRPVQFYEFGAFQNISATIEVWGTNSTLHARAVRLQIRCFDLHSEWTYSEDHDVVLLPNQSTPLVTRPCPCPIGSTTSHSVVVTARIVDLSSDDIIARYADWPQPYRHVELPEPQLEMSPVWSERSDAESTHMRLSVKKPAKGVLLSAMGEGEEVKWSDNALDLVPGDPQIVIATGLGAREVKAACMGWEVR